jgi:hypothetical protein
MGAGGSIDGRIAEKVAASIPSDPSIRPSTVVLPPRARQAATQSEAGPSSAALFAHSALTSQSCIAPCSRNHWA